MYIFAFFASSHLRSLILRCFFSVSILNELCISLKWKFVPYWRQGCYVSVLLIKLIFQICDLRWINLIWQFWWCGDIFCICRYRGSWGVTIEKVWNKGVIWILRTQINNFVEYLVKLFTSWPFVWYFTILYCMNNCSFFQEVVNTPFYIRCIDASFTDFINKGYICKII